jgi:hypothetical protein
LSSSNIARGFNQNGAVEHETFGKLKTFQKFKTLLSSPFVKAKLTAISVGLIGFALLIAIGACSHATRYTWDVRLPKDVPGKGTSLSNAVDIINAAVRESTTDRIPKVIILDVGPVTITKVCADQDLNSNMDVLIERYHTEMAPIIAKGAEGYETCPVWENFPARCRLSDVSIVLAMNCGMDFDYTQDGVVLKSPRKLLECRAYKVGDALLKLVEERQKAGQIYHAFKPVPVIFAQESSMTWSFMVNDGPNRFTGEDALDAVTFYLPDKKCILVIENAQGHKRIQENLKAKGIWQE